MTVAILILSLTLTLDSAFTIVATNLHVMTLINFHKASFNQLSQPILFKYNTALIFSRIISAHNVQTTATLILKYNGISAILTIAKVNQLIAHRIVTIISKIRMHPIKLFVKLAIVSNFKTMVHVKCVKRIIL